MDVLRCLLIFVLQFLLGSSLIFFLRSGKKGLVGHLFLSVLLGMGLSSVIVFFMELVRIPLTSYSIWIGLTLCSLVSFYFRGEFRQWFGSLKWDIKIYEIVPLAIILLFLLVIGWRASYYPPYTYDARVGIDLIAKYAVRDSHINGSLFTEILPDAVQVGNQLFYAPFAMLMQVLYMSCGITFGQMWLGVFTAVYFLFFYVKLKSFVHPIFAGFATLVMLCSPEVFSYSFLLQTDFANAAFFFVGVIFLFDFVSGREMSNLWISAIGFAFACWSRTETIFFVPLSIPFILFWDHGFVFKLEGSRVIQCVYLLSLSGLAVGLWSFLYVNFYLPDLRDLSGEFVPVIKGVLGELAMTIKDMFELVVIQETYWNYLMFVFGFGFIVNVVSSIVLRSREGLFFLAWIFLLFLTFALVIVEFPSANVPYTFRRGFFKFVPLLMTAILLGPGIQWLSRRIDNWENT